MTEDLDVRRRRLAWRASHRGTKELDIIIGRFADVKLAAMTEAELVRFEAFLAHQEPDLQAWLLGPAIPASTPDIDLILDIRRFHGLV